MSEEKPENSVSWSVDPSTLSSGQLVVSGNWSTDFSTLASFGKNIIEDWAPWNLENFTEQDPLFAQALLRDFIFLSSSADVAQLRLQVRDRLGARLADIGQSEHVEPYDWESDIQDGHFDQRRSMQRNLPRPADPRCRAVVAFMGERIGLPLEMDFPASLIKDYNNWANMGNFRLKHPWPLPIGDQLELVRQGFFPLTGTVFEYLDARAAGRPVFLTYIANRSIRPEHARLDPKTKSITYSMDGVILNGLQWKHYLDALGTDPEEAHQIYILQTWGVRNFINALGERGIGVDNVLTTERAAEKAMLFLDSLGFKRTSRRNPYRPLEALDLVDVDGLIGREEAVRIGWLRLSDRLWSKAGPPILRIEGKTGSGKSSFLRAGILAKAQAEATHNRKTLVLAFSAADFRDNDARPRDIARRILRDVTMAAREEEAFSLDVVEAERIAAFPNGATAIAAALAERLEKWGAEARLVIGLDQFEEVVDDLTLVENAPAWKPLFDFVAAALATGRIGIVYTLESTRADTLEALSERAIFEGECLTEIGANDPEFLTKVIRVPFANEGFDFADDALRKLKRSLDRFAGESTASLPLVSLKLHQLFEFVDANFPNERNRLAGDKDLSIAFASRTALTLADLGDQLEAENVIEELAEEAWQRRLGQSEEDELDDLDSFLTPFVYLFGDARTEMRLQAIPEPRLEQFRKRIQRFRAKRLILRDRFRRNRITHDAVIDFWPLADKWRRRSTRYLDEERAMRAAAEDWDRAGADPEAIPTDVGAQRRAADVLVAHFHSWPFTELKDLDTSDVALMTYAKTVFSTSRDPRGHWPDALKSSKTYNIHLAAIYGMDDVVARFLDADPTAANLPGPVKGNGPIHSAAWVSAPTVQLLIKAGADPVKPDNDGWPPMAAAIEQGDMGVFKAFLPHYIDPSTHSCPGGGTLLHLAAARGRAELAKALMMVSDINPNAHDENGLTPFDWAAISGQLATFDLFRQSVHAAPPEVDRPNALHLAAEAGHTSILERLIAEPVWPGMMESVDGEGRNALMVACLHLRPEVVRLLARVLPTDATVSKGYRLQGYTALHMTVLGAEADGDVPRLSTRIAARRTVEALLEQDDTDPNASAGDGRTAFDMARHLPEVAALLAEDPRFNPGASLSDGSSPLVRACRQGDKRTVVRLLKRDDSQIDKVCRDGSYPPAELLRAGFERETLRLLGDGLIRPWEVLDARESLLAVAISEGSEPVVSALLGALPEVIPAAIRPILGKAVAKILASGRFREHLKNLLGRGADADVDLAETGKTLLHRAAMLGDFEAFDAILTRNPRRIVDLWGRTPDAVAPSFDRTRFTQRIAAYRAAMTEAELPPPKPTPPRRRSPVALSARHMLPIHRLARNGNLTGIDRILRNNPAFGREKDPWGRTALDLAPLGTRGDLARLLDNETNRPRPRQGIAHALALLGNARSLARLAELDPSVLHRRDGWGRDIAAVAPLAARKTLQDLLATTRTKNAGRRDFAPTPRLDRILRIRSAAVIGDLESLARLAEEHPEYLLARDAWDRSLDELAPLGLREALRKMIRRIHTPNEERGDDI